MTYLTVFNTEQFLYANDAKIYKRKNYRLDCILLQRDFDSIAN